ncbi:unnamed protein product [Colias eurytheme]|nr:unnamed protein product [Colias eurytheme]
MTSSHTGHVPLPELGHCDERESPHACPPIWVSAQFWWKNYTVILRGGCEVSSVVFQATPWACERPVGQVAGTFPNVTKPNAQPT